METNEIKKLLYKQNPTAQLKYIRKGTAYYQTLLVFDRTPIGTNGEWISFEVPISDMGDADFLPQMQAKFLIRWILNVHVPVA